MKKVFLFLLLSLTFIVFSCDNTETPSPEPFEIMTTTTLSEVPLEVTYSVYKLDNVKVDLVQYVDAEGLQTLTNPTLPWNLTLYLPRGVNFHIKAKGIITQGKIVVKMDAFGEESGHSQTVIDSTSKTKY